MGAVVQPHVRVGSAVIGTRRTHRAALCVIAFVGQLGCVDLRNHLLAGTAGSDLIQLRPYPDIAIELVLSDDQNSPARLLAFDASSPIEVGPFSLLDTVGYGRHGEIIEKVEDEPSFLGRSDGQRFRLRP